MTKKLFFLLSICIFCSYASFAWGAARGQINSGETRIGINISVPSFMDTGTFNGSVGERVIINADTGDFELLKLASKVVTVTETDGGGCPVADVKVSATIKGAGKKRIGISPSSKITGENGKTVFTITAKEKSGKAKVTFKAGSVTEQITVTVVKE